MLLITTADVPVLVIVSVCVPLRVPTTWGTKVWLGEERVSVSGSRRIETM
jgi:hypothetical protein